ncbi:MAG: AraC family transcriptional regulator [Rhodocyclaceae bacterium]|nr:MAG: AraC family transcriptional regulator [Rhodocyclaceae bacterium]
MPSKLTKGFLEERLGAFPLFTEIHEKEEACSRVGSIFRPHMLEVVGGKQKISAHMDHLPLKEISANHLIYRAKVQIQSEPLEDFFLVLLPMNSVAEIHCGKTEFFSNSNLAAIVNPNCNLWMQWQADCSQFILRIDKRLVDRTCEALIGRPIERSVEFQAAMDVNVNTLWEEVISLVTCSTFSKTAMAYPLITAQAEQMLVGSMLIHQSHTYSDEIQHPRNSDVPRIIRRAEEFMVEHCADPITMIDVARHLGVSLRSLYNRFQHYRSISPKAFLKGVRLDLVRRDLLEAKESGDANTVTNIAISRGFSHLGHFTKAYLERFGELPSKTIGKRN